MALEPLYCVNVVVRWTRQNAPVFWYRGSPEILEQDKHHYPPCKKRRSTLFLLPYHFINIYTDFSIFGHHCQVTKRQAGAARRHEATLSSTCLSLTALNKLPTNKLIKVIKRSGILIGSPPIRVYRDMPTQIQLSN